MSCRWERRRDTFQTTLSNNGVSPMVVTGLANGTKYYFNIGSINILGAQYATAQAQPGPALVWNYPRHQPGFSSHAVTGVRVAVSASGTPYLVYRDVVTGKLGVVADVNGTWTNIGASGFATGSDATLMMFDRTGAPAVCFKDAGNLVQVMKYDGAGWTSVGSAGFVLNGPGNLSIARSTRAVFLTLLSRIPLTGNKLSVFTFQNDVWAELLSRGVSTGAADSVRSRSIRTACPTSPISMAQPPTRRPSSSTSTISGRWWVARASRQIRQPGCL